MLFSRWKMMAGVLGVSLGGLAAYAGQCPKADPMKGATPTPDVPMTAAAQPPAPAPMTLPPLPVSVPVANPVTPVSSPPSLPVIPASGTLPALPDPGPATLPPPSTTPSALPSVPSTPPQIPPVAADELPPLPLTRSAPAPIDPVPATPPALPSGVMPPTGTQAIPSNNYTPPMPIPTAPTVVPQASVASTAVIPASATVVQSKYRILLRVGEGEPVFEVRCGDDLLLKVVCEKVDVKSPEKGQSLSAVKASGKVRFSGFGAEGTCDELNFMAGTGEVGMTGAVKIFVKDKLGRVESELSTEMMKYKIDPHAIVGNGTMKP